jgi:hypothetical protein
VNGKSVVIFGVSGREASVSGLAGIGVRRITPAMAAGVTPKLWSLTDMVRVIEDWEIARSLKISGKTMVG